MGNPRPSDQPRALREEGKAARPPRPLRTPSPPTTDRVGARPPNSLPPRLGGRPLSAPPPPRGPQPQLLIQHSQGPGARTLPLQVSKATSRGPRTAPSHPAPEQRAAVWTRPGPAGLAPPHRDPHSPARPLGCRAAGGAWGPQSPGKPTSRPAAPTSSHLRPAPLQPPRPLRRAAGLLQRLESPRGSRADPTPGGALPGQGPQAFRLQLPIPKTVPGRQPPTAALRGLRPARGHSLAAHPARPPACTFEGADLVLDGSGGVHVSGRPEGVPATQSPAPHRTAPARAAAWGRSPKARGGACRPGEGLQLIDARPWRMLSA